MRQYTSLVAAGQRHALNVLLTVLLLLSIALPPVVFSQVSANIWRADTAWFNDQLSRYEPFDMSVHISVRNTGLEAARDVRLQLFSQEALMFKDKLLTRTVDVAPLLAPGDSIDVLLDMKQNIRHSGKLRYLPQLYWRLEWSEGSAQNLFSAEGRGITMNLGDCAYGAIYNDIVTELTPPDTILLDPGLDTTEHVILEVPCKLYSSIHRPLVLQDVTLDVEGESVFREPISVQRLQPSGSLDSLLIRDTLLLNFRVSIPVSIVSTALMFHIQPGVYLESGCAYSAISDAGRRIPVHVVHPSERKIDFTYEVRDVGSGGPEMHVRIGSWCGSEPVAIDSRMLEITDSDEPVDLKQYNPQSYSVSDTPLRVVFAIDLTGSMGQDSALARAKDLVKRAAAVAIPGVDSLILYTLTDSAQHHTEATSSPAALMNILDTLQIATGTEVFSALNEAVEQEIRFPHDGEVLMYFITDGWQPYAYAALDSVLDKADDHGIRIRSISPVLDFNTEVMHWYYLPGDVEYDMIHWRINKHRYSWGYFSYPISCAFGIEREIEIAIHGWCGTDTLLSREYQLSDLAGNPRGLRLEAKSISVKAGASFPLIITYSIPKGFTWNRTEFVLEYDTLAVRLDSIGKTGLLPGGFFELEVGKGNVHFVYRLNGDSGIGTIAPFYFSAIASMDSVQTAIRCHAWARRDKCIPGFPVEVGVTVVPLSTDIDVPLPAERGFQVLSLFPQPARNRLMMKYRSDVSEPRMLKVYDLLGRLKWQGEIPRVLPGVHDFNLDLPSTMSSGTYILQVWTLSEDGNAVCQASRRFQLKK